MAEQWHIQWHDSGNELRTTAQVVLGPRCKYCLRLQAVSDGLHTDGQDCTNCGRTWSNWAEARATLLLLDETVQRLLTAMQSCGHPLTAIHGTVEGTSFCTLCAVAAVAPQEEAPG